jgi:dTDP-4-amino-4,6-dideoxygalactose transaminase
LGKILINDMGRHAVGIADLVGSAVQRVTASGWYILGEECGGFEREFAAYCGVGHCVGVANGTDAIELALRALGVASGDRVATVANAGLYTTTALNALGARPVYVDVDESTHLMDLEHLSALVDAGGIAAIVVTHLYGLMHDMDAVMAIAGAAGVPVLEDCAQAHGARRAGRMAGGWGDAASFSFYPTKNLGGIGDGGAIVTGNHEVAARARRLRQYGWASKYHAVAEGARNSRLDEIQAAVLRVKLPLLDAWNARRRSIAERYSRGIANPRVVCPPVPSEASVAHLYVITCDDRDSLRRHLFEAGVMSDVHYPIPDHLQPSMSAQGPWPSLPVTEKLARSVLTLPCYPELPDDEVDLIIERVNAW